MTELFLDGKNIYDWKKRAEELENSLRVERELNAILRRERTVALQRVLELEVTLRGIKARWDDTLGHDPQKGANQ